MTLRYLSQKQDVTMTIDNIKCKCNQYPGVSISRLMQNLIHDLGYMCNFMHCIQRPMSRAWLATVNQDTLHKYRCQWDLKDAYTRPTEIWTGCPTFNSRDT
mgnify:CR=1 FL=1